MEEDKAKRYGLTEADREEKQRGTEFSYRRRDGAKYIMWGGMRLARIQRSECEVIRGSMSESSRMCLPKG